MAKITTEQKYVLGVYRPGEDSSKLVTEWWDTTCTACGVEVRFMKVDRYITGPNQAVSRPTRPRCEACFRAAKALAARQRADLAARAAAINAAAANAADPAK